MIAEVIAPVALFAVVRRAFLLIEFPVTELLGRIVVELNDAILVRNRIGRPHGYISRAVVVHFRGPLGAAACSNHPFS